MKTLAHAATPGATADFRALDAEALATQLPNFVARLTRKEAKESEPVRVAAFNSRI